MKKLETYTLKQITDYLIDKIAKERSISKKLARQLFTNAIAYNVVVEAIDEQIDYLIDYEESDEANAILKRIEEQEGAA